jgi:1-acyl-sn-glycerol-3-phosphate acyltransferase
MDRSYEPPRSWTWPHYHFAMWFVPLLCRICGGHRVVGAENVPDEGGAVIASNHLSHLDPPVVGTAMPRRTYYFAAAYLFNNPIFGFIIRKCYAFPVKRGAADTRALKNAIEVLKAGELLTMFPEGTRSRTGELGEFDLGAALAASRAGVPIVPCAVTGTNDILPRGASFLRRGRVAVSFGEPIDSLQFGPKPRKPDLKRITDQVEAAVHEMKDEQRAWVYDEDSESGQEAPDEQATS